MRVHMVLTRLHELWEDNSTPDGAGVRHVIRFVAVRAMFIAAGLVDLPHVAVVRVLVACEDDFGELTDSLRFKYASRWPTRDVRERHRLTECSTGSWGVERLKTVVVEQSHLVHPSHLCLGEHHTAHIPERLEHNATLR